MKDIDPELYPSSATDLLRDFWDIKLLVTILSLLVSEQKDSEFPGQGKVDMILHTFLRQALYLCKTFNVLSIHSYLPSFLLVLAALLFISYEKLRIPFLQMHKVCYTS